MKDSRLPPKGFNKAEAHEPKRFTTWFDARGSGAAEILAESTVSVSPGP